MPGLAIHLLGRPRVEVDGAPAPSPRGHKPWALLVYLLLSERPPSRSRLVGLLFAGADDPLGALRWNLSQLRAVLPGASVEGDPVRLELPPGTAVDVRAPEAGGELLEGLTFPGCPAFEIWLETERRYLAAAGEARLREAALGRLATGDAAGAADLAGRLVALNPFDENFQALLVRALAASGDGIGAARQVARCTELFRRELGIEPSPALATAAQTRTAAPVTGPAGARAQLEAGEAAIRAGALDAGLECLRRAVVDAGAAGDDGLHARALVALGTALVHAARGRDEEAAAALHSGLRIAEHGGHAATAAAACRELGFVEFLQARYDAAVAWLARAADHAGDDVAERARVACILGSVLTDTADYRRAKEQLEEALALDRAGGDARHAAYTLSMIGRLHLLREELDAAAAALDESLETAARVGWTALRPWPESLRGDVDLARGELEAARARYEHAFALGCQLGDPCWEGLAARGLGRLAAADGDVGAAVHWLTDARRRALRLPDGYRWVDVVTLDALCDVGGSLPEAGAWIDELAELAARGGMRELAVRACLHRARCGDESAAAAARLLAEGIDNPALAAVVEVAAPAAA